MNITKLLSNLKILIIHDNNVNVILLYHGVSKHLSNE